MKTNNKNKVERQTLGSLWDRDFRLGFAKQVLNSDDNWLNKVEEDFVRRSIKRKRRNTIVFWGFASAFIGVILTGLYFSLRGQKQALIEQIGANQSSTETELRTNHLTLEALINSVRAGKTLKHWLLHTPLPFSSQIEQQRENEVITTLRQAVYQVKELNRWNLPPGQVLDIFFGQNDQLFVAIRTDDVSACIWDSKTEKCSPLPLEDPVEGAKFSPDGKVLAIFGNDRFVRLWNRESGQIINKSPVQLQGLFKHISFSQDGRQLAIEVGTDENSTGNIGYWWSLENNRVVRLLNNNIIGTSFNSDGHLLIALLEDANRIKLLNSKSGQESYIQPAFFNTERVSFSNDGKKIIILSAPEAIASEMWNWNLQSNSWEQVDVPHLTEAFESSFGSDGKLLATTGHVVRWYGNLSSASPSLLGEFNLPQGEARKMILSPDSKQFVTQEDDGILRLWNAEETRPKPKFSLSNIESVSFSPDSQTVATISTDSQKPIRLWDLAGNLVREFPKSPVEITCLSFSHDGKQLVTGGEDGFVRFWDLHGNELKGKEFRAYNNAVRTINWTQNGQIITTTSDTATGQSEAVTVVSFWNLNGNHLRNEELIHLDDYKVRDISFQHDGRLRTISDRSHDGSIQIGDDLRSRTISTREGTYNPTYNSSSINFNADGSLFATASRSEDAFTLWDLQGRQLMKFRLHERVITDIDFSTNGSELAIVYENGEAQLLQLGGLNELLWQGCEQVRDYLATLDSDRHLCDGISEPKVNQPGSYERISAGDKILVPSLTNPDKQAGVEAIASGDFATAVERLNASLLSTLNDPEARIYLNNARIGSQASNTIAVSVPLNDVNSALEILRGVAQAQELHNKRVRESQTNELPLKIIIADDRNNPKVAQAIAKQLADNPDVLGVIGHFSSGVTRDAAEIYNTKKLVAISPVSTSIRLSDVLGKYVFRTVPSDGIAATQLAEYMLQTLNKRKAVVFYNEQSEYSKSLRSEFTSTVKSAGGLVESVDLSASNFVADQAVENAIQQGAEAIVLMPNIEELDKTIEIIKANDGRLPLLAGDDVYGPSILERAGEQAIGMIVAIPWHIGAHRNTEFSNTATQLWQGPVNWRTATAYNAAKAFITAIKQDPTREGLAITIRSDSFTANGATSNVTFQRSGDLEERKIQLVRIIKSPSNSCSVYDYIFIPEPEPQNKESSSLCY